MSRKKIMHVIERFNVAGAEIVVKDLLLNMPKSEWDVEVCVLQNIGRLGGELSQMGYPIHHLNWKYDYFSDTRLMRNFNALIRERGIDIVHSHNITPWYFTNFASLPLKVKRCVTLHGFICGAGAWKRKIMYALLSRFTDKIIIVSDKIRDQLAAIPLFDMKKLQTVINGVDIRTADSFDYVEKRKSLGLNKEDFVLGTVGRFYPEKNIEMQIRLIHALADEIPSLKLVVVAERYGDFESVEKMVKELKIEDRVIFTGLRRDVPELLKIFDIFIMSSFSEGTSLALLEAMSSGLASVVSNVGGNSSIISHEDNGILFDVQDFEFLKRHISELYHNDQKRSRLAQRAKESGERYSIANMVQTYGKIYQSLSGCTREELC